MIDKKIEQKIKRQLKQCKIIDVDRKNKYIKCVNKYYIWHIKKNTYVTSGQTEEIAWKNAEKYFKNVIEDKSDEK